MIFITICPKSLSLSIRQNPATALRLLVYHKDSGKIEDKHFYDIIDYLKPGDVLVINDTKVIPARIYGHRDATGGKIEFLLHKRIDLTDWEVLAKPARKALPGNIIRFSDKLYAEVLSCGEDGIRHVRFHFDGVFEDILREIGEMPLPHYIHEKLEDDEQYQTVYARESGSSARAHRRTSFYRGIA